MTQLAITGGRFWRASFCLATVAVATGLVSAVYQPWPKQETAAGFRLLGVVSMQVATFYISCALARGRLPLW